MTWSYKIAGDALPNFRGLPIDLQEEVLDELDRVCDDPSLLPGERGERGDLGLFHPVIAERDERLDVVLLHVFPDADQRILRIASIRTTEA